MPGSHWLPRKMETGIKSSVECLFSRISLRGQFMAASSSPHWPFVRRPNWQSEVYYWRTSPLLCGSARRTQTHRTGIAAAHGDGCVCIVLCNGVVVCVCLDENNRDVVDKESLAKTSPTSSRRRKERRRKFAAAAPKLHQASLSLCE